MQANKSQFLVEVKSLTEAGTFEGLLSPYGNVDNGNDVVEKGAFSKTMQEHGNEIPMLWQHKADEPIGKLTLEDSEEGLRVKGELMLDLPEAKKAYLLMKAGIVKGLSIGYACVKKSMTGAVRHLKEVRLYEGSVVTFPMNEAALISAVKAGNGIEQKGDFDQELLEIQLYEAGYQMFSALRLALYEAAGYYVYGDNNVKLTDEERIALSATIIDQFRAAYMAYLPQYLQVVVSGGKSTQEIQVKADAKAGRAISAANRDKLQSAVDIISALLTPAAAGDSTDGDSTTQQTEAATKSEPVPATANHSAAENLIEEMRSLLSAA